MPVRTRQQWLHLVRATVEEVLGRPADPGTSFFDLGLSSLGLTRVRLTLQRELGRPLADTTLFDHADVTALATHLAADGSPAPTAHAAPRDHGEERVAVIGMAVRFPGAGDLDGYWANLRDGVCAVRSFDGAATPGRVPVAGVLDDVDRFDASFFGISDREAELTDPAHRLFLEVCQNALEHGGHADRAAGDERIGVYAGSGMNLYGPRLPYYARHGMGGEDDTDGSEARTQGLIGGQQDFLATRVAYRLGLTGAAVGVQTACSTSLVAVHLAVQSLLTGDNDLALAGAAAVHLPQDAGYVHEPEFILSPSGVCRAFDEASDGTVGGNGVAAVLLKRLDRALEDGDEIHAVLIGSAVNNDGDAKAGFTAPGVRGHTDTVRRALARARADPASVGYVEAHGTGTALGDRVEFEALSRAYGRGDGLPRRCAIGSVKPSVGHLDTCAGMAGLIKTVLMLRHRTLVPTVNQTRPDPRLPWSEGPFRPVTETSRWTAEGTGPLRAGVSALGFGGTNAHVILEEPPTRAPETPSSAETPPAAPAFVPLSAHTPEALRGYARRLRDHLRDHPRLPAHAVGASLSTGRPHLPFRAGVHGGSPGELADGLDAFLAEAAPPAPAQPSDRLAFAFSGQGIPALGAALGWYREHTVVRDVLDACEEIHRQEEGGSLLDVLLRDPTGNPRQELPRGPQPVLFALQLAQARLWRSYGAEPGVVLGHSLGELAALCAAGAFSLEDGLRFTAARERIMSAPGVAGAMLAVAVDAATAAGVCEATGADLAAANGPRSQVLSGTAAQISHAIRLCEERGAACLRLGVDRAFHSALLDPVLPELRAAASSIRFTPTRTPCGDAAGGTLLPGGTVIDAEHLVRQARRPVRFDAVLAAVAAAGPADFVEIGPGDVLTNLARTALPGTWWTPSRRLGAPAPQEALGALYRRGVRLDWSRIGRRGLRVSLPGRPFSGARFPVPSAPTRSPAPVPASVPAAMEAGAPPSSAATQAPTGVAGVATQQLDVLGRLLDTASGLMTSHLRALGPQAGGTVRRPADDGKDTSR